MEDKYRNFTEVVTWPEIQYYMDKKDFRNNTALINSEHGIEIYGSSAYRMNPEWKKLVDEGVIEDIEENDSEYTSEGLNIDYGFPYNINEEICY